MLEHDDAVILADWGNSSGRLYCIRGTSSKPEILDVRRVAGAKDTDDCPGLFANIAKNWVKSYDIKRAFFTGGVTSNIGWTTTEYTAVPARISDVQHATVVTDYGLTCTFLSGTSIPYVDVCSQPSALRRPKPREVCGLPLRLAHRRKLRCRA